MHVLEVHACVAIKCEDFLPVEGDVSLGSLVEIEVDDRSKSDGLGDALDVIGLGDFGPTGIDLLHDFLFCTAYGFIQDFIRKDDIALPRLETLPICPGNHPELYMDRAVRNLGVAHPAYKLEYLLEVKTLFGSYNINIPRRGVRVPAVDACCSITGLVQRCAIGFTEQTAWILVIKVHGNRTGFLNGGDPIGNGIFYEWTKHRFKPGFAKRSIEFDAQTLIDDVEFCE